jgi:RNA ligase partner protein
MVIDTSVFTNPEIRGAFGPTPTAALRAFLDLARKLRQVEFYMPPSIWAELGNFLDPAGVPADAELVIQRKPPNKYELTVPAFLLYELIDDVRRRVDKGLRLAEEAVRGGRPGSAEEERIAGLRKKYREALREGIIDSTEDVELILLAKELGAIVVSADRGVVTWAEKLGLPWIEPAALKGVLESLASSVSL